MSGETMRAVRFHQYGPASVLAVDEVPRPEPGEGEVLLRVHAAGVNPVDWKYRAGDLQKFAPLDLPFTPGLDVSGTVESAGQGVTQFAPGQAVFGRGSGTYAEYAVAPVTSLAVKPDTVSFDVAATIPVGGVTAWAGLFFVADVQPGQRVLIQGAAGGVGAYAVQLAKWRGASVAGTASAGNLDFVRSLGADEAIDYAAGPIEQVVSGVDVVFDTVGGEVMDRSWQLLRPGGILLEIAGMPDEEAAREHGVRTSGVRGPQESAGILWELAEQIARGAIRAPLGKVFPLEQAEEAQVGSETGHGRGRIVLHVAD